jgi:uncharacterized membrane protein
MPPANITDIPQEDRALLTAWYRAGQ